MKIVSLLLFLLFLTSTVITIFAVETADMHPVDSSELTAEDKATKFLSSVVGLDLTEYALVMPTPPPGRDPESWAEIVAGAEARRREARYPPELCGIIKDEWSSLRFAANGSNISVMSNCLNGLLSIINVYNLGGDYIYSEPPATPLLNQAKTILQRYQTYVTEVDAADSSYLVPMQNILNSVDDLSPTNVTIGNVNFQVSKSEGRTRVQWIYTENNITMNYKRVELEFRYNAFESFQDGWRFYKVSGLSALTLEEAYKLALDTAQNCEFRWVNDEVNEVLSLPDLSDARYDVYFAMVPYRNDTSHTSNKLSRDPLTLYPYWRFCFYFKDGAIGCFSGVRVSLWGDTEEIISCEGQLVRRYPNWG